MSSLNILIGQLIKKYRNLKGYSTQALAEKLSVSPGLINNIENANNDTFKLDILIKLIEELNIPVDEFNSIDKINIIIKDLKGSNKSINIASSCGNIDNLELLSKSLEVIISSYMNLVCNFKNINEASDVVTSHILTLFDLIKKANNLK